MVRVSGRPPLQIKISLHWSLHELSALTACVRTRVQTARIARFRVGAFEAVNLIQDIPASSSIDPQPALVLDPLAEWWLNSGLAAAVAKRTHSDRVRSTNSFPSRARSRTRPLVPPTV